MIQEIHHAQKIESTIPVSSPPQSSATSFPIEGLSSPLIYGGVAVVMVIVLSTYNRILIESIINIIKVIQRENKD